MRIYKGYIIERCGINSSWMRWTTLGTNGYLKADTLSGIKELIKEDIRRNGGIAAPTVAKRLIAWSA